MRTTEQDHDGSFRIRSDFDRRILRGLSAEYENALWLLPDMLRAATRKPLFSIKEMKHRLGFWDPGKREITLGRELVENGRWDDIREVLLHEMAHQVTHEAMAITAESDHGPGFRQACRLLRANPKASGTYAPLHERLHQNGHLDERDRIVMKIHKLLALADSSNPNEAQAAMAKAHELIRRHNVALIEGGNERNFHSVFLGVPRLRHFREAYHLAHLLQDYYFVQGVWIEAWVVEKEKMGRVLEINGTRTNVQIAAYVYDTVYRYIDTRWEEYGKGRGLNRYRKTDFAVGIIQGFESTLARAVETGKREKGNHLPVCVTDHALARFMTQRYPNLRSFSRRGPGHDPRVLADGTREGKNLVIAKGITRKKGYQGQRLAHETSS